MNTSIGFSPVKRWMISKACLTILIALAFFPVFLPANCIEGSEDHSLGGVEGDIINEAWIADGDLLVRPSGEELRLDLECLGLFGNLGHCGDNYLIIYTLLI